MYDNDLREYEIQNILKDFPTKKRNENETLLQKKLKLKAICC